MRLFVYIVLLLPLLSSVETHAQIVEKEIVSDFFAEKETRKVKVWKSDVGTYAPITNVVYVFDAKYYFDIVVSNIAYGCSLGIIPPSAVVGVYYREDDDRTDVGLTDMKLNRYGESFSNYLSREVMPFVNDSILKTDNPYNIFFGHSYLADYGCYYIANNSSLFDAYLLFAPEVMELPSFDKKSIDGKRIFIATGTGDAQRRVDFSHSLYKELADSLNPNYSQLKLFDGLGHLAIVPVALPYGLNFIYKEYVSGANISDHIRKDESMVENYERLSSLNAKNYKCGLLRNAPVIASLSDEVENPTAADFERLAELIGDLPDANLQEIIGFTYLELGDLENAEKCFEKSIKLYIESNIQHRMSNAYRGLMDVYASAPDSQEKVIGVLDNAIVSQPRLFDYYYARGRLLIIANESEKGIRDLKTYLDNYDYARSKKPLNEVYYLLAKGYYQLSNLKEAQHWLSKSLAINSTFEDAVMLNNKMSNI